MDNLFNKIISLENLFASWKEFRKGKRKKIDVQEFERNLEDSLFALNLELKNKTYRHSDYTSFYVTDPKSRHIHKACVKDRIVHHAIYRILYPMFNPIFIDDSYSCRNKKRHSQGRKTIRKIYANCEQKLHSTLLGAKMRY